MSNLNYTIRRAIPDEHKAIGALMVQVFASVEGFPKVDEQPKYYNLLRNIGALTKQPTVELFVAISKTNELAGVVVFFQTMEHYGSGGIAPLQKNTAGFRLLAVDPIFRGTGVGKSLCNFCVDKARLLKREQLIIHTTNTMKVAWSMYKKMGFQRSADLDFMQNKLHVFGFRLYL